MQTIVFLLLTISAMAHAAVVIDNFTTKPIYIGLVEGRRSNVVAFEAVASSTDDSDTVPAGLKLWTVSFWGSKEVNGMGQSSNFQQQVLTPEYASIPLTNLKDGIVMNSVFTQFDMTDLKCVDVPYLCAAFTRDPNSSPPFEMEAYPDESVLTHCFLVSDYECTVRVIATDLDFVISLVPPDDANFDIDVSILDTSEGTKGNNLWRVGFFTSPDAAGSTKNNYDQQILTGNQSSTDLEPGDALKLDNVNTQVDLYGLGCEEGMKYVCLEFAKERGAKPDFEFEVSGGGNILIKCLKQKCQEF